MRVLHVSDTHLGFQAYDHVNERGVNTREADVYAAFERVIDDTLRLCPDLVLHTGDFFHRPSPSNRALTFALEQLRRLADAGIPMVVVAGNHETPRNAYTTPILKALSVLPGVEPLYEPAYAQRLYGELCIHALPHMQDARQFQEALASLAPRPGCFNILCMHLSLSNRYLMEEYGEQRFPDEAIAMLARFDYVALGHWHNMQKTDVKANAWYAGSTERFSDTEAGIPKGFLLLDTAQGHALPVFHPIATRPWHALTVKGCKDKTSAEVLDAIAASAAELDLNEAIVSLSLLDMRQAQWLELNHLRLREYLPQCLQLNLKRVKYAESSSFGASVQPGQFESLEALFAAYLHAEYSDQPQTAQALSRLAQRYFSELS